MAKTSTLHEYARIGAAGRLTELRAEVAEIHRMFPDLAGAAPARKRPGRPPGRPKKAQPAAPTATAEPKESAAPKRKRRKMSAAARKAISDAQKKRWAKVKASKTP
jgi:hypothetical protein